MSSLNGFLDNFRIPAEFFLKLDVSFLLNFLGFLLLVLAFVISAYLFIRLLLIRKLLLKPHILLEANPLRITELSPYTTEQLFNLFHSLAGQSSWIYRMFNVSKNYSFEIVSSKNQGIRYLIRVNQDDAELIKKSLLAYLPGLSVKRVKDYLSYNLEHKPYKITEFKLANHFAFPLKKQEALDKHDPIAYMTGSMTKLSEDELISFQLVVSPLNKRLIPDIKRISKLIYSRGDLVVNINDKNKKYPALALLRHAIFLFLQLLLLPVGLLVFAASEGKEGPLLGLGFNRVLKKTSNPYQQELEKLVKTKLDQHLFSASARLLVVGKSKTDISDRKRGFISALSSYANSGYQAMVTTLNYKVGLLDHLKRLSFKYRIQKPFGNLILSVSEIGDLYHFPFTRTTKTEDLVKSHSRQLPAPISLKSQKNLDVVFAKNTYGGNTTQIGLTKEERRRHVYILGATGTGKSTMLLSMINQDISNGKGLCVIDPHGDLIENILPLIPKARVDDVVYFNPDDIGYPIGINLLELTKGLSDEDAVREKEFIAESIISIFHKVYTKKYSGPRMEYILRNTIHTAFAVPGATLFTIYKLLINTPFRKSVVRKLSDENLKDFWRYEFAKAGDYQKVKMISPITNKIGRFLFSPTAKRVLEQEKSTVSFDEIINQGKILLCNVSKGKIGEDNSEVFGVLIMAKIQLAALKRSRVPMKDRKDFYLYVDEFQNFASPAFAQIISEARKYRLNAILAHQTTSQLEDKSLVNVTLANTGTVICFKTANPEDERLILPQFKPFVEPGEISSLPSYNFYMRLGALNPEEPFSGVTVPIDVVNNKHRIDEVIKRSRKQFAIRYVKQEPKAKEYWRHPERKIKANKRQAVTFP